MKNTVLCILLSGLFLIFSSCKAVEGVQPDENPDSGKNEMVTAKISGDQIIIKDNVNVIDYYIKAIHERLKGSTVKLLTPRKMMEYKVVLYNKPNEIVFGHGENNSNEFLFTIEVTGKEEKAIYNCCATVVGYIAKGREPMLLDHYELGVTIVFTGPFTIKWEQNTIEARKVKSEGGRIELVCPSKVKINTAQ